MIGSGWLVIQIGRLRLEGRGNCLVLTPWLGLKKISLLAARDSRADEAAVLSNGAEATRVDQSPCFPRGWTRVPVSTVHDNQQRQHLQLDLWLWSRVYFLIV